MKEKGLHFNTFVGHLLSIVTQEEIVEKFKQYSGLAKSIRAHGNFAEHVPFALLNLLLLEINGLNKYLLHMFGIALIVSRILHIEFGVKKAHAIGFGRRLGMQLLLIPMGIMMIINIMYSLPYLL